MECIFDEFENVEKRISDCGSPPPINNAMYNVSNGIGLFSSATYYCESGYGGTGPSTVSCMEDGAWPDQGFQCIKVCGEGYETTGYSCSACQAGTYSPAGISNCLYCPSDQYNDLRRQESCMNCTINDNPCGNVYTIPDTNVIVEPSDDRTECRAIYFCRTSSGISIESQNVYVSCDRDGYNGAYTFQWTRPSLHCISGVSSESISSLSSPNDAKCEDLQFTNSTYEGQIVEIRSNSGGTFYCDTSYDGDYWTVIQQRSSALGTDAFDRPWSEFKNGFGSINNDFWIGNDNLHRLTKYGNYEALFLLWMGDGNYIRQETARYRIFRVKDEDKNYELVIDGYDDGTSDAGNEMEFRDGWMFSTKNYELAGKSCSYEQKSGWWHTTYSSGSGSSFGSGQFICLTFGNVNSLKWIKIYDKTRVLIKPT